MKTPASGRSKVRISKGYTWRGTRLKAFRPNVADAATDLLEAGEIHIEIIAHASVRAHVAA
jgi:hypothetical protein